ncbi:hypothetical protein [Gemmatimonas sp.]|jgi:hypothetical protein|uniref:hypothetical protein n=1 Tax=Gemmatimonas sp. TaxID=1962908 RepID=UPI00391EF711
MTWNLLLWHWAPEYDTPSKRKKKAVKFTDITSQFAVSGDHPAIGDADISAFRIAVDQEFGENEHSRPFVFHDHGKCATISYPDSVSFQLVQKIATIGRRFGLNASDF